jgi:hypothetical protein
VEWIDLRERITTTRTASPHLTQLKMILAFMFVSVDYCAMAWLVEPTENSRMRL